MFGIRQRALHHYGRIKELPGNTLFAKETSKGKATQQAEETLESVKLFTFKLLTAFLTLTILAFLAVFMYGMFYFTFVPSPEHEGQIFLEFEPCDETPGRCGFLNGSLQLSRRNQILMAGQPYTVSLLLQMPESPINRNSGMFMACAQLKTRESSVLRHNCKSSMLQYRSELLRIIDTFVFLPGYLTGHLAEKQGVHVVFFDDFYDDPLSPALQLDIQVKSRFVEIYSAIYRIHANFSGIRYLMFHYPLTSAFLGSSVNMILLTMLFLLSWFRFFLPREDEQVSEKFSDSITDPFLTDENEDDEEETDKESDTIGKGKEERKAKSEKKTEGEKEKGKKKGRRLDDFFDSEEEKAFVVLKPEDQKKEE